MTGKERSTRERFGAIFFAFVMVTSMVAIGGVAFSGSAAAADGSVSLDADFYTGGDTVTVTVTDSDLNTDSGVTEEYVVNVVSDTENITADFTGDSASDDDDSDGSYTYTTSQVVADRNQDNKITKADFDIDSSDTIDSVNRQASGKVQLTISDNDGDTTADQLTYDTGETVLIQESNQDSDTFTGTTSVVDTGNELTDNDFAVSDTDTVTVTYRDESASADRTDTATVDLTTPDVSSGTAFTGDSASSNSERTKVFLQGLDSVGLNPNTVEAADFRVDTSQSVTDASVSGGDVTLTLDGELATDAKPNVFLVDGQTIEDNVGQTETGTTDGTKVGGAAATDNLMPEVTEARQSDTDKITVTFSEDVEIDDGGDSKLANDDLIYNDNNGQGAVSVSSVSQPNLPDDTAVATVNADITSNDIGTDQIKASSDVIDDTNDNTVVDSFVTVQNPSGFELNGDSNTDISTDIGGNSDQTLRAGSSAQSLGLIKVKDVSGGDSPLASRTILTMPDGVTINAAESSVLATTTSGGFSVTGTEVVDESTLRIEHSGSSNNGETLRVSGVVVDVAPDVSASQGGAANAINVDYATGSLDSNLLTVEKPQLQTGGTEDVSAGAEQQNLEDSISTITIQASGNVAGQIANGSDIVINANQSNGVTFDADVDPTTLTTTTTGNAEVDMSAATLTKTALTIPVTDHFNAGDKLDIDVKDGNDELFIDVAGDATDSKFSGTVVANQSSGDVAL